MGKRGRRGFLDKNMEEWEFSGNDRQFVKASRSMLNSPAFRALTANQLRLYLFAKFEWWRTANTEGGPEFYPTARWPDSDEVKPGDFYLNRALLVNKGLYNSKNDRYKKDLQALVEKGFLDVIVRSRGKYQKSVYRMSSRWKNWK